MDEEKKLLEAWLNSPHVHYEPSPSSLAYRQYQKTKSDEDYAKYKALSELEIRAAYDSWRGDIVSTYTKWDRLKHLRSELHIRQQQGEFSILVLFILLFVINIFLGFKK